MNVISEPGPFRDRQSRGLISGPAGALEIGCYAPAEGVAESACLALVCHPHPLHGGTMDNKVVTTLARSYRDLGVPAMRFNFRGAGKSEGVHDHGRGEVEDVLAALDWGRRCYPGRRLLLAGFSFGSAMAAAASHRLQEPPQHLVLVAPPVERYDYDRDGRFPCPTLVLIGDRDELVDVPGVERWQQKLQSPSRLQLYSGACHFFHGQLGQLKQDVMQALQAEGVL